MASSNHGNVFRDYPICEAVIVGGFLALLALTWKDVDATTAPLNERQLTLSAVSGGLTAGLTVAVVVLSAAFIGAQLFSSATIGHAVHVKWTVVYSLGSLATGALAFTWLPSYTAGGFDFATVASVAMFGGMQLALMLCAATRLMLAVLGLVKPG